MSKETQLLVNKIEKMGTLKEGTNAFIIFIVFSLKEIMRRTKELNQFKAKLQALASNLDEVKDPLVDAIITIPKV